MCTLCAEVLDTFKREKVTASRYSCISAECRRFYVAKVTAVTHYYHAFDVNCLLLIAVLKAFSPHNFVLKSPKGDFMC
jgi:hypothetical protein